MNQYTGAALNLVFDGKLVFHWTLNNEKKHEYRGDINYICLSYSDVTKTL